MTDTTPTDADPNRREPNDRGPSRDADLTAVVVERDLGPDECTIYPRGASDETLITEWLTAEEGSYVALDEMR